MAEQNLKLNVTADVSAAQSALKKLNSTLEKAKGVITDISGGGITKSIDDPLAPITEGAKGAVTALEKVREALRGLKAPNLRNLIDKSLGISRVNGSHFETEFEQRRRLLEDGTYAHATTAERRHRVADSQSVNYRSAAESAMVFERNGFASAQTQYLDWIEGISQASNNIDVDALLGIGRAAKSAAESAKVFESADAETSARNLRSLMHERELYADYNARIKETAKATKAAAGETSAWSKISEVAANGTIGFGSSLSHLFRQFKHIATYRIFKSILKGITDSFKIGTQNLVQYSAAMSGLDAAAANPTMSEYATQLLYVRNSVAAAAMPALQALVPVISTVANWFVAAANAVNQFISILQGKSTFTRAKEYAVDYADSIGGIGSAAGKAAKQMQQLMDFDEINNIISPKDSGGGGGGGAGAAQDFLQMFEEAAIDSKFAHIAEVAKGIYEDFKKLIPVIEIIGAGILLWKVSTALINTINDLMALSGMKQLGAGILLSIGGIILGYEGGKLLAQGDTLAGVLTSAFGVLAAGVGGALVGTFFGVGGWTIAVPMMILAGISIAVGYSKQKFADSELGKYLQSIKDTAQDVVDDTAEILSGLRDEISKFDDITNKADIARGLADALFEITKRGELTRSEIAKVKAIVNELNGLGLDDLKVEYNELTGEISMTKDEIYKVITAYEKQAKTAALMSLLENATKAQIELEREHKRAVDNETKAKEAAKTAWEEYNNYQKQVGIPLTLEEISTMWELGRKVDATSAAYEAAKDATKKSADGMAEAKKEAEYFADELATLANDTDKATEAFMNLAKKASVQATVEVKTSGIDNANEKLGLLRDKIQKLTGAGLNFNQIVNIARQIDYRANGGFPTQGSLFIAGETVGQTEWLGNVNGKTGVVSGGEITGIAEAIYDSSAAERAELQKQNNLLTKLLEKQLTITPSAALGRVNAQSAQMYGKVTGA